MNFNCLPYSGYPTPPNVTISKIIYNGRQRTDVNVEWLVQAYGDVTGFFIERQMLIVPDERRGIVPVWERVTENLEPSTRSYQITNLDPSTIYAFRVTPVNRRTIGYPSEIKSPGENYFNVKLILSLTTENVYSSPFYSVDTCVQTLHPAE